jgi:hypothetical protein
VQEILVQPIWNNSLVKIGGIVVNYQAWQIKNITHVQDLITPAGQLMSKAELENKYNFTCKQMKYNSIISAIPTSWKKTLINEPLTNTNKPVGQDLLVNLQGKRIRLEDVNTKDIYRHFLDEIRQHPTSKNKWAENLNFEITPEM